METQSRKLLKNQRIITAKLVEEAVLGFDDSLIRASKTQENVALLMDVDKRLEHLMAYNRLAVRLKLLSFGQYENLASELGKLVRLLGGWRRR